MAVEEELIFPAGHKKVRIPFKLINNLVVVPIQVNDSKPLNFVVDTGVDRIILMELSASDSISLNNVEHLFLRGLGQGEGINAYASKGNKIKIAGVEANNQNLLILEENIFNLSSRLGIPVNGIIGYPLFKNFVVEINYAACILTLYKPNAYPEGRAKNCTTIPLEIENQKPYVLVEAIFENGAKEPIRLIVDSGMSTSVMLYPPTLKVSALPQKTIDAYLGRGLNGDIYGEIGRITALNIGGHLLHKPAASFPDTSSIRYALGLNNRNGNLGADVLRRFRVVFDYGNSRMLLAPNYKFKKPFYFNLSGMELLTPFPGINFYTVADVLPNSPADLAGLKKGDDLISINGEQCAEKSLKDVLYYFQNRPGRVLRLRVRRELETFDAVLQLQDII
ncbi:MAG: aspartyl protease family protein [Rufibacter sp.]